VESPFDRFRALPFFWLSLAFLVGIILASQVSLAYNIWIILAGIFLLLALRPRKPAELLHLSTKTYLIIVLSTVSLCLGGLRYQLSIPKIDAFHIAWYNDRDYDLLVTGTLSEPPDYRDTYTNLHIKVEAVDTGSGDLPVEGELLARVFPNETYEYGERVRIRGKVVTPPENEEFSYREYLARQGVHSYMSQTEVTHLPGNGGNPIRRAIYTFKDKALENIYLIFPDPEASLLAGILLGVDTGLPKDLQQAFKDTGTAHIIAISGFNIAIIAGLFFTLFSRLLGQTRGSILAILGIAFYTFLVGADAAVVRAAIMGGLSLVVRQVGRRNDGMNALMLSAVIMSAFNPNIPWDVGFQLSFFATLGLILYAEPFQSWAVNTITRFTSVGTAQKIAAPVSEYILLTLAAQLTTLPIMAYHFKRISLVSLIANPFILPVQPAVMIVGGIAVILSLIWLPLGAVAAFGAWPFVAYTIRLVELFNQLPNGVIILGDFSLWLVILFYAALFTWTFARHRVKEFFSGEQNNLPALPTVTVATILTILVMVTWRAAFTTPDGNLHISFLDVGSADAILIQTPGGRNILVNGGPSVSMLSDGLGRRLPPLNRRLDWLVIASTQENQLSSLPRVVERIPPSNVLWAGNVEASFSARNLDEWFVDQNIPVTRAEAESELELGDGAVLKILNVSSRGAVLLLEWNEFRALLPIGMNFSALEELKNGEEIGMASLLLLGDSGYAPINPPEWVANLNPQLIVLSVAAGDKDGLPHEGTLEATEDYPLLRTDENGWVEVTTDGIEMWIEVQRQIQSLESSVTKLPPEGKVPADNLLDDINNRGYILVSTDPDNEPLSFLNTEGQRPSDTRCPAETLTTTEMQGFDVDVAIAVGKDLGVDTCFITPNWDNITAGSWAGEWDVSIGSMAITTTRKEVLDFSVPYSYTLAVFAVNVDSPFESIDDLASQVICAGDSTIYESWLNQKDVDLPASSIFSKPPADITVFTLDSGQECAQALAAGRRDFVAYLTTQTILNADINAGFPVKQLGSPVLSEALAPAYDKSSALPTDSLRAAVDDTITGMQNDGTLTTLSIKWFNEDITLSPNQ